MLLPDVVLTSRSNQLLSETGIDSKSECLDKRHFDSYPYPVEYNFNSRGFRDSEWPTTISELQQSIWCFGDSFTVGLGAPLEHTWVNILQQRTSIRCINISLDGASNNWIARKINRVLEEVNPAQVIVQWSYLHRDEDSDASLSDEDRRKHHLVDITSDNQLTNFENIRASVNRTNIIESFIPGCSHVSLSPEWIKHKVKELAGPNWPDLLSMTYVEFVGLGQHLVDELKQFNIYEIIDEYVKHKELIEDLNTLEIEIVDLARDGHHYDYLTANKFVDSVINRFNEASS